jgi:hypothetical protein
MKRVLDEGHEDGNVDDGRFSPKIRTNSYTDTGGEYSVVTDGPAHGMYSNNEMYYRLRGIATLQESKQRQLTEVIAKQGVAKQAATVAIEEHRRRNEGILARIRVVDDQTLLMVVERIQAAEASLVNIRARIGAVEEQKARNDHDVAYTLSQIADVKKKIAAAEARIVSTQHATAIATAESKHKTAELHHSLSSILSSIRFIEEHQLPSQRTQLSHAQSELKRLQSTVLAILSCLSSLLVFKAAHGNISDKEKYSAIRRHIVKDVRLWEAAAKASIDFENTDAWRDLISSYSGVGGILATSDTDMHLAGQVMRTIRPYGHEGSDWFWEAEYVVDEADVLTALYKKAVELHARSSDIRDTILGVLTDIVHDLQTVAREELDTKIQNALDVKNIVLYIKTYGVAFDRDPEVEETRNILAKKFNLPRRREEMVDVVALDVQPPPPPPPLPLLRDMVAAFYQTGDQRFLIDKLPSGPRK